MKEINENELKDVTGGAGKVVGSDDGIVTLCPEGYVAQVGFCIKLIQKKQKSDLKIIPR